MALKQEIKNVLHLSPIEADARLWGRVLCGYYAIWDWSAPRISGRIGQKHDAFFEKYGAEAYYARINKVRKACGFKELFS